VFKEVIMVAAATRQDIQTALDRTKNSILGSMLSRNDVQISVAQLRNGILQDLHDMHADNMQVIRQSQAQRDQVIMVRVSNIERNTAIIQQLLVRLVEQQARAMSMLQRF
jgi:hypothetical protein